MMKRCPVCTGKDLGLLAKCPRCGAPANRKFVQKGGVRQRWTNEPPKAETPQKPPQMEASSSKNKTPNLVFRTGSGLKVRGRD